jgi:hypothetical protein
LGKRNSVKTKILFTFPELRINLNQPASDKKLSQYFQCLDLTSGTTKVNHSFHVKTVKLNKISAEICSFYKEENMNFPFPSRGLKKNKIKRFIF